METFYTPENWVTYYDWYRTLLKKARLYAKEHNKQERPVRIDLRTLHLHWVQKDEKLMEAAIKDLVEQLPMEEIPAPPESIAAWAKEHILPAPPTDVPRLSEADIANYYAFKG